MLEPLKRFWRLFFPKNYASQRFKTDMPLSGIWDETDFISCLEVLPVFDEDGDFYLFQVAKDDLRLELTLWSTRDVRITLNRASVKRPILDLRIHDCSGTRYVNDQRGEYLEFAPSHIFGNNYRGEPIPVGVRLSVKPSIQIEFFGF